MSWKRPAVLLLGPTNAGKSTLFNTLSEQKKAITSNIPGTTRDINTAITHWNSDSFVLLDTGGLDMSVEETIDDLSIKAAKKALPEVDLVLLMFDAKLPRPSLAREILELRKTSNVPWFLVLNKVDSATIEKNIDPEWYKLDITEIITVSAVSGRGTGELMDAITDSIRKKLTPSSQKKLRQAGDALKISFIGKPNVGKSSLMNAILNEEKSIVSDVPHTTRDTQDATFLYQKKPVTLVDTAGITRRSRITKRIKKRSQQVSIEKQTVQASLRSVREGDVSLLVLDISQPLAKQDIHLAQYIARYQKPAAIIVNKWDLVPEKTTTLLNKYEKQIRHVLPPLTHAPIIFTSALEQKRVHKILDTAFEVHARSKQVFSTDELYQFLDSIQHESLGKNMFSIKQTGSSPLRFQITHPTKFPLPEASFPWVTKKLRQHFDLSGAPIIIDAKRIQKTSV